ncbi:MAG: alcohol dehydrogenase (cytochrome c) [Pseudohongiellaceae bacterium]|jgi:alcohol dehydrogenase (cytochrome c)
MPLQFLQLKPRQKLALVFVPSILILIAPLAAIAAEAPASSTFTEAQYERGETVYQQECALCHGQNLDDGVANTLRGQTFRKTWSRLGVTVADLYNRIANTMPPGQLGELSESENIDVLAYILGRNNVLQGTQELNVEYEYLSAIPISRGDEELDIAANFIEGLYGLEPTGSGPSFTDLLAAAGNAKDWLYHNHNYQGTRYSALTEIDRSNVTGLQQRCAYQLNTTNSMQAGPIVYEGIMYVTDATHTAAINAATCEKLWVYEWEPKDRMVWGNNRGVAIKDGYVLRGTPDGYLFALDSANGNLLWARQVADPWLGETFTMAPIIFDDLVVIGPAGSENAISGWVAAFSVADGDLVWKFMTVPEAAAGGGETWGNPKGIALGGGAVWTPLSMDIEKEELYVAVTNPAPDFPAYLRPGENLYTNCIVALDVRTGELKWYRSIVPNDDHDWDLTQVSPVLKKSLNNVSMDMIATVGKDGILRTLNAETHEPLYETPVTTIENYDVPVTEEGVHACPGVNGGVLWSGPAYYPADGLLITPAVDYCNVFIADSDPQFIPGQLYMGGGMKRDEEMSGWLTAIEVESGEVRWKYRSERPMVAGVTTTAGGLVISGDLNGNLLLLDASTGEVLHSISAGAMIGGSVVSYEVDGKQYIAAGTGTASGFFGPGPNPTRTSSIIIYSLPD